MKYFQTFKNKLLNLLGMKKQPEFAFKKNRIDFKKIALSSAPSLDAHDPSVSGVLSKLNVLLMLNTILSLPSSFLFNSDNNLTESCSFVL